MKVSLVIPGRNAAGTIKNCLESVVPILDRKGLGEIIFVDDGSTDDTAKIVQHYPIRYIRKETQGPGAARNTGWHAANCELIWFIDADCVAEPDAMANLIVHLEDPAVAGAGGSYSNGYPQSLLACLVHEEIIERHLRMPSDVNHLGSFNVLYRRSVLKEMNGFDESLFNGPGSPGAEDMELSYRIFAAGYRLVFDRSSIVRHFHPTRLRNYLRAQRHHGFWRARLHFHHPNRATGDTYSSLVDNVQPPIAMIILAIVPLIFFWPVQMGLFLLFMFFILAALQIPMTIRLVKRTGLLRYSVFGFVSFIRAFARGLGMIAGLFSVPFIWKKKYFG